MRVTGHLWFAGNSTLIDYIEKRYANNEAVLVVFVKTLGTGYLLKLKPVIAGAITGGVGYATSWTSSSGLLGHGYPLSSISCSSR